MEVTVRLYDDMNELYANTKPKIIFFNREIGTSISLRGSKMPTTIALAGNPNSGKTTYLTI